MNERESLNAEGKSECLVLQPIRKVRLFS